RARGSASTSAHHSSPVGSCGCDHDRRSTASRACSIAAIRLAMSASEESSRVKFGGILLRSHWLGSQLKGRDSFSVGPSKQEASKHTLPTIANECRNAQI